MYTHTSVTNLLPVGFFVWRVISSYDCDYEYIYSPFIGNFRVSLRLWNTVARAATVFYTKVNSL